ncbi:MAG: hypothetical protein QOJ55_2298, partial [Solirubrobacteraceae bacterium]|nr:hypothetical protein [Solirubrobacteraceae bacterium]
MASTLLGHVRGVRGEEGVQELLEMAGVEHSPTYLADVANWIWYEEAIAHFEAARTLLNDDKIARRV